MAEKLIVDNFYEDLLDLASEVFESRFAMSEAELRNCGTGAGGFKFGNKCALGGAWWAANGGKGGTPEDIESVAAALGNPSGSKKSTVGPETTIIRSAVGLDSLTLAMATAAHGDKVEAFRKRLIAVSDKKEKALEAARKEYLAEQNIASRLQGEHIFHTLEAANLKKTLDENKNLSPASIKRLTGYHEEAVEKAAKSKEALTAHTDSMRPKWEAMNAAQNALSEYHRSAFAKQSLEVNLEDGVTLKEHGASRRVVTMISETGVNVDAMSTARLDSSKNAQDERVIAMATITATMNPAMHSDTINTQITYGGRDIRAYAQGRVVYSTKPDEILGGDEPHKMVASNYGVTVGTNSTSSTIVHEFGHALEHSNAEVAKLADDFLQSRVGNEKPVKMARIAPGRGYRKDEAGRGDDFQKAWDAVLPPGSPEDVTNKIRAHYAGKKYDGQGDVDSRGMREVGRTEVLSMGLEMLHRNPVAFAKADPGWFNFVVGVTSGRYLTHTRATRVAQRRNGIKKTTGPLTAKFENVKKDGTKWVTPDGTSYPVYAPPQNQALTP